MNREKYPNFLLATFIVYALTFMAWFGFFFVPLAGVFVTEDFYIISVLLFLPAVLFGIYYNSSRFQFLWGKEKILSYAIVVLTLIDALFVIYMLLWML
jgi:hypothetical protein